MRLFAVLAYLVFMMGALALPQGQSPNPDLQLRSEETPNNGEYCGYYNTVDDRHFDINYQSGGLSGCTNLIATPKDVRIERCQICYFYINGGCAGGGSTVERIPLTPADGYRSFPQDKMPNSYQCVLN